MAHGCSGPRTFSETACMASSKVRQLVVSGNNRYSKAIFLRRLPQHAGASTGRRGGGVRKFPPKTSTQRCHLALSLCLGILDGYGLSQQLTCGARLLLPPARGWRWRRGHSMQLPVDLPAATQGTNSPHILVHKPFFWCLSL